MLPSPTCEDEELLSPCGLGTGNAGRAGCSRDSGDVPVLRGGPGRLQDRLSNGKNVIKQGNDVRGVLRAGHTANPGLAGCAELVLALG